MTTVPHMSWHHIAFIASVFASRRETCVYMKHELVKAMADALSTTNAEFNRDKFIAACMHEDDTP